MFRVKLTILLFGLLMSPIIMATPASAVGSIAEPHAIACDNGAASPQFPKLGQSFSCYNDGARGLDINWYGKDLPASLTLTITYSVAPDRCDSVWNYYDDTFDGIQGSCKLDGNKAIVSYPQLPSGIPDSQTPKLELVNFTNAPSPPFTAVVEGSLYDPGAGGGSTASIEDNVQTITDSVTADDEANENIKNQDTSGEDYSLNSEQNQSLLAFLTSTVSQLASIQPAPHCVFDLPYPGQIDPSGNKAWGVNACEYEPPGIWTTVLSALAAFFWIRAIYSLLNKVLNVNREAVSD